MYAIRSYYVDLSGTAPYGDKKVHRNEHGFPENIEEHKIKGHENAQHGCFHDKQTGEKRPHPGSDITPGTENTKP